MELFVSSENKDTTYASVPDLVKLIYILDGITEDIVTVNVHEC